MVSGDADEHYARERERIEAFGSDGTISEEDANTILEFLSAKDREDRTIDDPDGDYLGPSSRVAYGQALRLIAKRMDGSLTAVDTTADTVNDYMDARIEAGKLSQATAMQRQSALRVFYRWMKSRPGDGGPNITPEDIYMVPTPETKIDSRDVFDRDDIQAMRDAIDNSRDRCVFELLLNTGQRVNAIRTLRIKDVDATEGVYWLNTDKGGLKGASGKRPLLGAKRAVFDWLRDHPASDDRDAYLITKRPSANQGTAGDSIDYTAIYRALQSIKERAGVSKDANPHAFRHAFVTMCKRDYDMDSDTIRHLIGHGPTSNVMETTYQHLNDDDYIKDAERAAGFREDEPESPLTPPVCPTCSEPVPNAAKACASCGTVFAPDAMAVESWIDDADDHATEAATEGDSEQVAKAIRLREALKDDETASAIADALGNAGIDL